MNRLAVVALAAVAIFAGSLCAQETPKPPKAQTQKAQPKVVVPAMIQQMIKAANLSEDQQKQLMVIVENHDKAVKEFNAANADKLKAAREEAKKAQEAKDKDAIKKANEALAELNKPMMEIKKKFDADVLAVLTPEQQGKWTQFRVTNQIKMGFARLNLTDEQKAKIDTLYADLSKGQNMDDPKLANEVAMKLRQAVQKDVLTDAQREALKASASAPASRPASAKSATP